MTSAVDAAAVARLTAALRALRAICDDAVEL